MDRDRFVIKDVKHFSPNEPMVKINDDFIEIRGKRDERQVTKHKLTFILFTILNFKSCFFIIMFMYIFSLKISFYVNCFLLSNFSSSLFIPQFKFKKTFSN